MPINPRKVTVERTCMGCMPYRQGVRLLQVVQLLYAIYSLALGIFICTTIDKDPTTKGGAIQALANTRFGKTDSSVRVFAYILTGLLALEVTVVLVGIYSVVKRIVGDFKFFAYAGIFLSIIELGFSIGRGFYVLRELPVVFAAVCFYLYRPYINTMKVENAEIEDEAAVVVATLVAARAVVAAEAGERPNVAVATVST
ncbi:hypothetical protein BC828DRAFT_403472 [Blastocladiella britannica]|nr:hypothetical protein BC828DRAFT_403472 [Blastocladiella britannica]